LYGRVGVNNFDTPTTLIRDRNHAEFMKLLPLLRRSVANGIHHSTYPSASANKIEWIYCLEPKGAVVPSLVRQVEESFVSLDAEIRKERVIPPAFICLQAPTTLTVETSLEYLSECLPLGARFLEEHPGIGTSEGRNNAHGKAMNHHVAGICHSFPHLSIADLGQLLDVYLPVRLAIDVGRQVSRGDQDDLEAAVENTDLILYEGESMPHLLESIWTSQSLAGCDVSYALCRTSKHSSDLNKLFQKWSDQRSIR